MLISNKFVYYCLLIIFFMALLDFFIKGYDIIEEKYGVNIWIFTYIFIICELFFNLGIYLILKGSGVLKVRIKDLFKFRFTNLFSNKVTYYGFLINRTAAIVPWAYVLIVGFRKLPVIVVLMILIEICIVILVGLQARAHIMINNRALR